MTDVYEVTTRVVAGLGSLAALSAELDGIGARRLAVVVDEGVAASGLLHTVLTDADPARIAVTIRVAPDPGLAAAEQAAATAVAARCDAVLAVGGGSALGAAKAVAIRLTNDEPLVGLEGLDRAPRLPAPTVAVPTTAGSGSEVSKVLVLHERGRATELVIRLDGGAPRVAILDATVLRGLPPQPMLYAGLDALSHSLESLWSRRASSFTRVLAAGAAATIIELLPLAADGQGERDDTLQRLLEASCAANMACGNSGLTLVHALSGAPSVHLPHGLQNGILLPHVAAFNEPALDATTSRLVDLLPELYERLAFTPSYAGLAPEGAADAMLTAAAGHPFRANNPRTSSDGELRQILQLAGV